MLTVLVVSGCTSRFDEAVEAYDEARYASALEQLQAAEVEAQEGSFEERARYALYRGLAHLATGNAVAAEHWLGIAKDAHDRQPRLFDPGEQGRLLSAWRSLGRFSGQGRMGPAWLVSPAR